MSNAYKLKALKTARFQQPIPILESRQSSHSFFSKISDKKVLAKYFPPFFLTDEYGLNKKTGKEVKRQANEKK